MDSLHLIWNDLNAMLEAVTYVELSKLGFFGLWLIILFMPLKRVDQRDPLACMVYIVFLAACAAALIFALPNQLAADESSFKTQFLTLTLVAAIACIRWSARYKNLSEFKQQVFEFTDEIIDNK